ncbi:hypothetical protein GQ600_5735 [Phytophthora cactorum]|nr:hypothetical protein GQ600_5735 [Phytophthora cactorum]
MSSNSCSSKSGHCAFCGEEGRGTFTKLKPLRWRFLTNKAPRTKYMCSACAEKRQVPQKTEQPVSLDSSWDGSQKHSEPALRLEHLESHDAVRQQRKSQRMQSEKREKLQERYPERRENRRSTREPLSSNVEDEDRHKRRRHNTTLPSRESIIRNRPASTVEIRTRTSVTNQRASVETLTRPRKSSTGQSEPRGSEKKDQRLTATNYFAMSSSSPTFSAPEHDSVDWRQIEMQLPPTEARKKNETEEERQRRRSASYAHMLVRMRRHYDTVQVNGTHGPPLLPTAKDSVKEDEPVKMDPADFAVDLDYLRAYKDAR